MSQNKKSRILILPSWYPPAGGGFFRDHAEALSAGDYIVWVVANRMMGITRTPARTILHSLPEQTAYENGLLVQRKGFIKLPLLEKLSVRLWIRAYTSQIRKFIKVHGCPDLIIIHSAIWAGVAAVRIKNAYRIPVILVEHRSRFASHNGITDRFFKNWYTALLKETYEKVNRIVLVSGAMENKIKQYHNPSEKNKITVIPNLVNTDFFHPPSEQKKVTMFTFITVAFLEEVKGIEYLLKAFQLLTLKIQNQFELRIAGSGTLAKHLDNYAVSLGIKNQVHFTGYLTREGVRTNLQEAHVFVLPSIIEAFGVALIEAMSVGLPVIATRSGGPESLVTKDTGILVPVRDSKSLAEAMEKMYLHYKTYNRKTIRDHALNNFSPDAVYLQWHNLIKEVLDESDRV